MSCLDCSCILRTPVESIQPEKQSQSSSHESLADSELAWIPPSKGGNEMIFCSSNVSHYELQVEIGRRFNNLTSIYLARHTPTGTQVAVRITDLESCSEEHLKALQNEVVLSHFFQHPNIMTLWTVFTAGSWLWVISPFMAYGSARHLLKTYFPEGMSEALIGNILFGAIRGLNYMHQNGYIHRNIKASHILISGDGLVYLSGLNNLYSLVNNGQKSKVVYDFPQFSTSVLPWLSPELLRQDLSGYNMKSDIYSVGITACELANGHVPFQDMPRTQMLLQKLKGPTYYPWDINAFPHGESRMKNSQSGVDSGISESMTRTMTSERLQNPASKTFSPAFYNLVELCLQQDPEKRPSASSLLSHTFFKQVKEQTQNSLLSLLPPPVQNSRSEFLTLPSAAAEAEVGCITATQHDIDWEF
ncbi:STE20-related kinase adapter protein beta isoform X1 [Gallus gallus]|uniref:STE20-related kinase adapter protein beta n=2 Tax=Gallus gallus TaxID=9031 RepID=A0A8V1A350_CHICK|nr:STE20-related kinase adapter protein beta isoform X1 [Gallus gallus]XP_040559841.1 STE20-related kinase adapter protein beta isoform X1 [Gallus gallus]XP_040559842.1 STE20-related kinase adapter protein beta isoform X1 [Gallus gallus]XP_421938.3 STE20-related kinase adapter protein beta isoform X1 [Gallus gallus]